MFGSVAMVSMLLYTQMFIFFFNSTLPLVKQHQVKEPESFHYIHILDSVALRHALEGPFFITEA